MGDFARRGIVKLQGSTKQLTCWHCKQVKDALVFQKHHLIPRSMGGTTDPSNYVYLCSDCHTRLHRKMKRIIARSRKLENMFPNECSFENPFECAKCKTSKAIAIVGRVVEITEFKNTAYPLCQCPECGDRWCVDLR